MPTPPLAESSAISSPPRAATAACPLVLFGSQTGNAADVADKVWRRALTYGAAGLRDVRVRGADAYLDEVGGALPPFPSDEWVVVFVCATAGQGDPPDNMVRFWRRTMRKAVPQGACKGLKIAVLGLGDSSYPKYNFVAKKLYRRLLQLGAEALVPLALADDQHPHGIDAVLTPWLDDLLERLTIACGNPKPEPKPSSSSKPSDLPFKFSVDRFLTEEEATAGCVADSGAALSPEAIAQLPTQPYFPPDACPARLIANQRLTSADHFQDTRHVVMAKPAGLAAHRPGQVLMVQPSNGPDTVATFLELLHPSLGPHTRLSVTSAHPRCHPVATPGWPQPCTLLWLARHVFDLNSVPRKAFFELLAAFSAHDTERERLEEFCEPANLDELLQYCQRARRTCVEVLQDFPETSRRLEARQLLELLPQIRPRAFSIASSAMAHEGELHLLVAVVDYKTRAIVKRRKGLCSNFLARATPGTEIPVWLSPSPGLRFPEALEAPLILIGPGTGLAPFRSVLHERRWLRERAGEEASSAAKSLLVFGCRYKEKDFYFREEWESLAEKDQLELITAFSREEANGDGSRLYVQDRLREKAELVAQLLTEKGASFYVAGNSQGMPQAVRTAVVEALQANDLMTATDAEAFVQALERCGRYQAETWA